MGNQEDSTDYEFLVLCKKTEKTNVENSKISNMNFEKSCPQTDRRMDGRTDNTNVL